MEILWVLYLLQLLGVVFLLLLPLEPKDCQLLSTNTPTDYNCFEDMGVLGIRNEQRIELKHCTLNPVYLFSAEQLLLDP